MFNREWRSALVEKALGRSVSYTLMAKRLTSIWAKVSTIQVTSAKNGYFLVRFTSGVDYERAITGGPWMVGDNYLTVHPWTKDFNPYEHEISSTMVWARLLEIPIQYFHPVAVMKIGQRIGKPLRVDHATSTGARSDYARVCVQVDLTKPLLSMFRLHGKKYFIQYEGLERICLQCGTYRERGHCSCMHATAEMETEKVVPNNDTELKAPETTYGGWMIAKKRPRRKDQVDRANVSNTRKGSKANEARSSIGGSRYIVLNIEEIEEVDTVNESQRNDNSRVTPKGNDESIHTAKQKGKEVSREEEEGEKLTGTLPVRSSMMAPPVDIPSTKAQGNSAALASDNPVLAEVPLQPTDLEIRATDQCMVSSRVTHQTRPPDQRPLGKGSSDGLATAMDLGKMKGCLSNEAPST
ncbi:unnamed protein product [Linum trigynum]|uniref:DUF4283 domain-containing protein n=1 Tax=Linum trigynum TaxID=586398 RepID=A0AAV2E1C9_9ROSI